MTKIIATVVLALGVLSVAATANAAPINGANDFTVHGYLGTAYGS
jgi:hypothetical protein